MAETGKKYCFAIGIYLIIKAILNLFLSFSIGNVITILAAGVIFVLFYKRIPYANYIIAVYLGLLFIAHFWTNVTNLGNGFVYWIYLSEGVIDLLAGLLLVLNKDVKAYFSSN